MWGALVQKRRAVVIGLLQVLDSLADGPAVFKSTAAGPVDALVNGLKSNLIVTRTLIPGQLGAGRRTALL